MVGVTTKADQVGESNIWDGNRPLTWALYKWFNEKLLSQGDQGGIEAAAFAKLSLTLVCRGRGTQAKRSALADIPTVVPACIRGGHSLDTNREVYIEHENASDNLYAWLLACLDEHTKKFVVSYPDFIAIDDVTDISYGSVSQEHEEVARRQVALNVDVNLALDSIFGTENINRFENERNMSQLLCIGLASHLYHREAYDKLTDPSDPDSKSYPAIRLFV
ncbi:hypothetical protein ACHAWF_004237 [Thalassiosira exigua]